ncbi:MAG: hypothetical protein M3Y74_22840 [Chloroflexota bacterium]|nr:hypothetical protein [Chloroflexota bacterium]
MIEWSVSIDARSSADFSEADAESIIDTLAPYAPVMSYGHGSVTARLSVAGDSVQRAIDQALSLFGDAAPGHDIFHVEALLAKDLDRELDPTAMALA